MSLVRDKQARGDRAVNSSKDIKERMPKTFGNKQQVVLFSAVAILLIAAISTYVFLSSKPKTDSGNGNTAKTILNTQQQTGITKDTDVKNIVQVYGDSQATTVKEVVTSNPQDWDRILLDKAYFNLLYAEKVSDFRLATTMLSMISFAQKGDLNIDDNSFGIDQMKRDDLQNKVNILINNSQKSQGRGL